MSELQACPSRLGLVVSALVCAWVLVLPAEAAACGGFFCSASTPVNQAAERIVFVEHDDQTVTAVVQIQYSGPAERFSWVLPVVGSPTVGLSSDIVFTRLQQLSDPRYQLNTRVEGECASPLFASQDAAVFADSGPLIVDAGLSPPVTVIAHSTIGPYIYDVIQLDPGLSSPGEVAVQWFAENGYDVSGVGASTLGTYLLRGMNLIAFKLEKGNSVGTLRPIRIRFDMGCPAVPIRPTAEAAAPDMGVLVWVVGRSRAVPTNYLSLELNEAALDWARGASNYSDVVTQAANEAGGHGFVTEHAAPSSAYRGVVFQAGDDAYERYDWENATLGELLSALIQRYSTWNGLPEFVTSVFDSPVTPQALSNCLTFEPDCSLASLGTLNTRHTDRAAFRAAFEAEVIDPVRETDALFSQGAYVTRLFTTLSADEMTVDPQFDFNPDLADVSNVHQAERVIYCSPQRTFLDSPWTATLPNGQQVHGVGSAWPVALGPNMPALYSAKQLSTSGPGQLVLDNGDRIVLPRPPSVGGAAGGACSAGFGALGGPWGATLVSLALIALLRRRARAS